MILFEDYLKDNLVLLDGAMGSLIYEKGVFIDKCYDELNLSRPDLIGSIHEEYVRAGSRVIETNTYGANRFKLKSHNLLEEIEEINRKGVELARQAAGPEVYVAGSMGPSGLEIEPWGDTTLEEVLIGYAGQARILHSAGVDLFILETFQDIREMEQAIKAIKSVSEKPVVAMMTVGEDGKTRYGVDLEDVTATLTASQASVIGLNCTVGPKPMLDFMEQMARLTHKPLCIMPNAGRPQYTDGRMIYMSTPEYFSVYTKRFIDLGVRVMGGCCGTTPDHISKMANALAMKQTRIQHSINIGVRPVTEEPLPAPVPVAEKSRLSKKILSGRQVVLVEMVPPRSTDITKPLEGARLLLEHRVDAINIPDGPRASARMTGLALAVLLKNQVDIETVLHYTCRDRNLLGMQSDLLGATAMGIRNILAITGDPPMIGDYPQATAVFDIDSIGLVHLINNLNHGIDVGGKRIGDPTAFFTGVGVDPNSVNPDNELHRLHLKREAGAEYIITQPVFDVDSLEKFLEKAELVNIALIAGIWPLVSLRNAEFMKNEVPGVYVPDEVIHRIARFETKDDQLKAGIEIAQGMVEKVRGFVQGIQVSAPFGRYNLALEVAGAMLTNQKKHP
jgi:homocysteine S-methyltransferase